MATIAEEINDLKGRVNSAYDACVEKGATIPTVKNTANLPECIRSISGGSPSPTPPPASYEDVCKEVEFCQSKLIEQGGKSDYAGAWIGLRYSGIDYENFTLHESNVVAVRTSDGAFYSVDNDEYSVTHHWDSSKDFVIEGIQTQHKFNWVIYYFSANSIESNSSYLDSSKVVNIVYVFDMDLRFNSTYGNTHNSYGLCRLNDILQSFDFIDNHRCYGNTPTRFNDFCNGCYSLTKLPDNIDTSSGTGFSGFCYNCYSLTNLPDSLDTRKGTNFSNFCRYCYSLTKLPDSLDTSFNINFTYFCQNCYSLTKLPDSLDISKGINFNGFCQNCYALTKANIILPAAYNITTLNVSNKLTVASMRYIADHAPTTSDHTLTIGSTNIARANAYDPTIITTLTGKGWTVN